MKTAISVDDTLMAQADEAARELGLSRSGFIAEALREFLRQRANTQLTAQLNRVYGDEPSPAERRLVRKLKAKMPTSEAW
jgi:metal-responsive CopG/Arc/MetJ family transcriptional regulator